MTAIHSETNVYIGARWEFHGQLYNANGTKMNVTNKTIEWALLDKQQQPVLNSPGDITITKLDPTNGLISIVVATNKTLTLAPGRYTDFCRVDGQDIMWTGQIIAAKSPFSVFISMSSVFAVGSPVLGAPELAIA